MSHGKQFTLYTHITGPNGWKVDFVLLALGLTYESVFIDITNNEHKRPPFTTLNPNGRIPALIDHTNGDFVIWESDAIMLYLVDKYDTEHKISVTDEKERFTMIQWLFFQASGQAPYVGQAHWFKYLHPEKLPSAVTRYQDEAKRVLSVLDGVISRSPAGWLVGGKVTIADLSFVTWNRALMELVLNDLDINFEKEYPAWYAWNKRLEEYPPAKDALAIQAKLRGT